MTQIIPIVHADTFEFLGNIVNEIAGVSPACDSAGAGPSLSASARTLSPVSVTLADADCGGGLPPSGRNAPAAFFAPFHASEVV